MKSVALHNLGCKVNAYEIDVMQQMLQENGYNIVSFDEKADIYIVNTCSVTNIANRKSRQMLHKAKKKNPEAIVIAAGCYVQTGQEILAHDSAVDLAVGNNRKKDIAAIIEAFLKERQVKNAVIDINQTDEYEEMHLKQTADHVRAYIKIQDGCNQFCSYCMIPYARGRARSRDSAHIISEIEGLAASGCKEIVLTGIHISSYGNDFENKESLLHLIEMIHEIKGIERIRIGSLEPRIVTEEFAAALSRLQKVCPHFHLSLQSGCDATLKRMNRHYSSGEYFEKAQLLRTYFEHPAITTDVIVGFPGETEEEFAKTEAFLNKINFFEMHIFKYSKRKGTKAADMSGQVSDALKTERSNRLLLMEAKQSKQFCTYYLGKEAEILLEEKKILEGKQYWIGHTEQYMKAALQSENDLCNKIVRGHLTGFLKDDMMRMKI